MWFSLIFCSFIAWVWVWLSLFPLSGTSDWRMQGFCFWFSYLENSQPISLQILLPYHSIYFTTSESSITYILELQTLFHLFYLYFYRFFKNYYFHVLHCGWMLQYYLQITDSIQLFPVWNLSPFYWVLISMTILFIFKISNISYDFFFICMDFLKYILY